MEENKLTNFLIKLWSILEDASIVDTICWDRNGKSFHIYDMYKFCEVVLPRFFKHKKMASFVRQLNLYGFKKIATVDRTALLGYNEDDHMQFAHPFFRHGHPQLLKEIKRNYTAPKRQALVQNSRCPGTPKPEDMEKKMVTLPEDDLLCLLEELQHLRMGHAHMENTICDLTRDNEQLWNEVSLLRDSHLKQQQNVGKLVKFLISLVQKNASVTQKHGRMGGAKRIPIEELNNPLAVAAASPALENWDVLSNIQEDILSEALNYSSMSALSPPSDIQMQPTGSPDNSDLKFDHPVMQQQQNITALSKGSLPKSYANPMMSPCHQLSMHLNSSSFVSSPNKTVVQLSPQKRSPANNQQIVQASSELIRMGRPYKVAKIVPKSRSHHHQQHSTQPSREEQGNNYVEEYYYENEHLAGPSSSYSSQDMQYMEEEEEGEKQQDNYGQCAEMDNYLLSPAPPPDGHQLMLYDAMNGIIEQSGWEDN